MKDDPSSSSATNTGKSGQSWFEKLFGANEPQDVTQLLTLLRDAHNRDLFDQYAMRMIEGVFDVAETRVRDIMIPRAQMTVIDREFDFEEVLKVVTESGHSRFPVIGDDKDELIGILLAKDLLAYVGKTEEFRFEDLLRDVSIIPESKRLNTLLNDFRSSRNHIAIVVDEYGSVSGLVTIEDVLEVIVGEIDDEHDAEEADSIQAHHKGHFSVDALTEIEEFNEHFGVTLNEDEADTVGGFVMRQLGHVPKRGEQLEISGLLFTILGADSRRIYRLKVTPLDKEADQAVS